MNTLDFSERHIGISDSEQNHMLEVVGASSLDQLIEQTMPKNIHLDKDLDLPVPMTERELIEHINELGSKNKIFSSYIGMGWYDTCTPAPIQRNILENPCWYTSYTPYQAEISQGRLEALFNYQTVITELTGLPLTNCSLLDEATAGAEAMTMLYNTVPRSKKKANKLLVDENVWKSTVNVMQTRAIPQGIEVEVIDVKHINQFPEDVFGLVIQYPNALGEVTDYSNLVSKAHNADVRVAVAADILSLAILTPPGEWGADVAFGSTQRFGIPMYFGGPAAAYLAAHDNYKRNIPGRIVGISKDRTGKSGYRLALQTREQHIKREKATSNICTAQALLATMAGMYAVYHGPEGLKDIASRIHGYANTLAKILKGLGYQFVTDSFFDTVMITGINTEEQKKIKTLAEELRVNLRYDKDGKIGISVDETTMDTDLGTLHYIFAQAKEQDLNDNVSYESDRCTKSLPQTMIRTSEFLNFDVFHQYHTETELMRYIKRLEKQDISLAHSMISLGSCTMKLNAASELFILSNPQFAFIHPYAPADQTEGYTEMLEDLSKYLGTITGLPHACLMPNSGAAGEYAGLRTIRNYFEAKGETERNIILLPISAHGTNPASAIQCGFKTVTVICDEEGNVDVDDFEKKAKENAAYLAGTMITYPSTHGIFEPEIRKICEIVHKNGGQVYMDGANMNAQVGYTNPGFIGADVCHLNLHKTFAIPHGGGGPGVGPIFVAPHLKNHLPSHAIAYGKDITPVSAAPFGSAVIYGITYAYIRLLGNKGLKKCTATAILSANYMAKCLEKDYGIVYTGKTGRVGHELILDCRKIKDNSGVDETDIAKRLIDYGYHAPTLSFPVHGTLMIEPTESESLSELDRFIQVMKTIRTEISEVAEGIADQQDNVLKNAPHPQYEITADNWDHGYSRSKAAYPLDYLRNNKFWINVARMDNGFGDRNLVASLSCCLTEK